MSVGVEVDALALMLDGAYFGLYRFGDVNVRTLEAGGPYGRGDEPPLMERATDMPEWAEVAEAILELEANADAWMGPGRLCSNGSLALQALDAAPEHGASFEHIAMRYLEAAALLRDGWRPDGWKAGER